MLLILKSFTFLLFLHLCLLACFTPSLTEDDSSFYDLLGVKQDADLLAIRKAFKKLAIQKHPDKNPDDPNAHSVFVRINRAYEVLKDEELRRKYDQFGEKGLEDGPAQHQQQYQSWQFYRDNFGIYDEDPEVVTLGRAEFHEEVFHSGEIWFVNFYSTFCSHCHQLAPAWRELAKQMPEGVVRIGAVNCAEDPGLCQSQRVFAYPSLIIYPKIEFYQGSRDVSSLLHFVLARLPVPILHPSDGVLPNNKPLLVELCSSEDCLSQEEQKKIAAIAGQIGMSFGVVECSKNAEICEQIGHREGIFYMDQRMTAKEARELYFADLEDLRQQLLAELPPLDEMDAGELDWLLHRPPDADNQATLAILFADQQQMDAPEWRRLPHLVGPDLAISAIPCHRVAQQCAQMHAGKLPRPALFRGGTETGFNLHYGNIQMDVRQVAKFVRQSIGSSLIVLDPDKYWDARHSDDLWLIDYFAPWCPPCLRLLAELRKMPLEFEGGRKLRIGTMDCEAHKEICQSEGVTSYPRSVLYNPADGSNHQMVGLHSADELLEFIGECFSPSVRSLDLATFDQLILDRPNGHLFFVDFYAPWCGPCQQLTPEFRRLARQWAIAHPHHNSSDGHHQPYRLGFGSVDCDQQVDLCRREAIRSYPTLRLYRHDPQQYGPVDYPQNWWRNSQTMAHWLTEMMPSLVLKLAGDFANTVLDSTQPFLVDFYAPWCSHCVQFAPTFEQMANLLHGDVRLGKVDCERFGWICQTAGVNAFPSLALYIGTDGGKRQNPDGWMHVKHGGEEASKIAQTVRQMLAAHEQSKRNERDEL